MEGVDRIVDLLAKVRERASSLVLQIQGRYLAVGDLHGDIDTLEKILAEWEAPYLFLGDYVDRGDRGLEVVTKVFELMLDGKAVVLRGNHESPIMNAEWGFLDELCDKLGRRCGVVYKEFEKTFASLPLVAVVNREIVALHGGIPFREDMTPASIDEVTKATDLIEPRHPLAFQILWNDPCLCDHYAPSPRGAGAWLFGRRATAAFHKTHGTKILIRGHTYVPSGCAQHHDGSVYTIFSSTAGPYKKTKPKVALVKDSVEVLDISTKNAERCPKDV